MQTANTQPTIFFNNKKLENDLEGELKGSVLFAQSTILPSRASELPNDIQPRLVSLRDTMLLFKPLDQNLDANSGFTVTVFDSQGAYQYSSPLQQPDGLPAMAERLEVTEAEFIEPVSYDYTIKDQSELNRIKDDVNGDYLALILSVANTVKIIISDGNWISNIYLPMATGSKSGKLVTVDHSGTWNTIIHYSGKTINSTTGSKLCFKNTDSDWFTPDDAPYNQAASIFADPGKYDYIISSQSEILSIAHDPEATYLRTLLQNSNTIKVTLADGRWASDFYLPEEDPSLNKKKVIFSSAAGYTARIHYANLSLPLSRGTTLVFININGDWREWSDSQYAKVGYGENFWHCIIPWQYVVNGMIVQFESNGVSGTYRQPDIGAPNELLIHTVDLGMLTANREDFQFQYHTRYHRDYFQTIPASRLIVNQYEPVYWQEIMLPNGTLYRDHSNDVGDVYSGDLRQTIGKELVSLGINNANYGILSSPGTGEGGLNNRFAAAQLTAHNSIGNYVNGRVIHGLSGGAGIVTLESSVGNEFSHEVGHNYGLGHYPNGFEGSIHRSAENINSTWAWDSDEQKLIPNFEKGQSGLSACHDEVCQLPFAGHCFGADAMAGGNPLYASTNSYTLYTPYSSNQIQRFLESKVVFDNSSSTGYSKWNEASKSMEEWAELHTAQPSQLDINSMTLLVEKYSIVKIHQWDGHFARDIFIPPAHAGNKSKGVYILHDATYNATIHVNNETIAISRGNVLKFESNGSTWTLVNDFSFNVVQKPIEHGVKTSTILGYYDPEASLPSYVYPALHCAYGHISPSNENIEIAASRCYAEVRNARNESLRFVLRSTRANGTTMNRFHINIASSFLPTSITIFSNGNALITKTLSPPSMQTNYSIHGRN